MKQINNSNISSRSCFGPVPLTNQLSSLAKKLLGKKGFSNVDLLLHWDDIMGIELSKAVKPDKITYSKNAQYGAILHVRVAAGSFAIMVEHQKKIILERANTFLGDNVLSDIRIRQDLIEIKEDKKVENRALTPEQSASLSQRLDGIEDPELRKKLHNIGQLIFFK